MESENVDLDLDRVSKLEIAVATLRTALESLFTQAMNRNSIPEMDADELREVLRELLMTAHEAATAPPVLECIAYIENRAIREFVKKLTPSISASFSHDQANTLQTIISLNMPQSL